MSARRVPLLLLLAQASCHLLLGHHPATRDGAGPERGLLDGASRESARDGVAHPDAARDVARAERPAGDGPGQADLAAAPPGTVLWARSFGGP